jgi:hypothetical protein
LAILDRVRALPEDTLIFSNGDDAIYLLTGRNAERVPERVYPTTAGENGAFRSDLARMRRRLANAHGVIVYFSKIDWRSNLISAAELQQGMRVRTIYVGADGIVFDDGES